MKYKAIYYYNPEESKVLGTYNSKDEAIYALLEKGEGNYCLDNRAERKQALEERDFCMIGCGPASMEIVPVD